MSQQCIEQTTLTELVEIMGNDMPFLIQSYIADTKSKLEQLKKLSPTTEQLLIFRLAHSLKGSSRNIGVSAFADYCETIEKSARAERLVEEKIDQQKLSRLFEDAIIAINLFLAQSPLKTTQR